MAILTWTTALWLIRRDVQRQPGVSKAIWIPTLWMAVLLSRLPSAWLGFGGASDPNEGSPLNRLFFLVLSLLAIAVLSRRRIDWWQVICHNWPLVLLYGYFLISIIWAYEPSASFKRWFKDLGNVFIALVVLTEAKPLEALKAVVIRCAYIWFPLSIVFIRWLPEWGRFYSDFGFLEVRGVTEQKNTLGLMVLVCGLVLLWEWFARAATDGTNRSRLDRCLPPAYLAMGAYLLYQCDSKTSILCLAFSSIILLFIRLPSLRQRAGSLVYYCVTVAGMLFLIDWAFGLKSEALKALGRQPTLTGRTEIWAELLSYDTDPIFGTGFLSFWTDPTFLSRFPIWMPGTAHNGYIETYLDGGFIAVALLILMLVVTFWRINSHLAQREDFAIFRLTVLISIIIGSYSESNFFRMSPLWFLFLIVALSSPRFISRTQVRAAFPESDPREEVSGVRHLSRESTCIR